MTAPEADLRSPSRRTRDEQIAAEPPLAPPELPPAKMPSSRVNRRAIWKHSRSLTWITLLCQGRSSGQWMPPPLPMPA